MDGVADYACDRCRVRKIACTREQPACKRCRDENITDCKYSRSGVIRRNRKRKAPSISVASQRQSSPSTIASTGSPSNALLSNLTQEIEITAGQLESFGAAEASHQEPLGALSSLSQACAAVWHAGTSDPAIDQEMMGSRLYMFEERAEEWTDVFKITLARGRPLFAEPPADVLHQLRTARPYAVKDRAWLVMYYSAILSYLSSVEPDDQTTKKKLQSNLWYALNDVRLLLEPSEINIQALILLASHVEEFTTPSLCWMLATNACRMLQTLGVTQRRFDVKTRERRCIMFWHLNLLDKGLAVIFGRPPTFHRAMAKEIPMPSLENLVGFKPHVSSPDSPAMFGAHFLRQIMLLSPIMGDVWTCLYDDEASDETTIDRVMLELDQWYQNAQKVLEAAAMTEKPFLNADSAASIDIGLNVPTFQYNYLVVLLSRTSIQRRAKRIEASIRLLRVLSSMVSDSQEVFNGIVWQLICCPFTAFLALFGEIVSNGQGGSQENRQMLTAMEHFPAFLSRMALRASLAHKLQSVAETLLAHVQAITSASSSRSLAVTGSYSGDMPQAGIPILAQIGDGSIANNTYPNFWPPESGLDLNTLLATTSAASFAMTGQTQLPAGSDLSAADSMLWSNESFLDPMVDWFGWEHQLENTPVTK